MSYRCEAAIRELFFSHEVFIFDFDGVILESVDARDEAYRLLFSDHGDAVSGRVLQLHKRNPGIDRRDKIRRCFREVLGMEPGAEALDERVRRFGEIAKQLVIEAPVVSGVPELMSRLDPAHCFVVSVAWQEEVRRIASEKRVRNWFAEVYGGPLEKAGNIERILSDTGCTPKQAVFVGDKISDFEAATATGVDFLARLPDPDDNPFPPHVSWLPDFRALSAEREMP